MEILYIVVILIMLVLSAFFSGTESSFNTCNKSRLKKAAESGNKLAALAHSISENFTWALAAILIGNNLANIAASSSATNLCIAIFGRFIPDPETVEAVSAVVSTVVLTLIVLICGEILPKILATQYSDHVVRWVAFPIRILTIILFPLIAVVMLLVNLLRLLWGKDKSDDEPTVTEEELVTIIDTVEEEGVINERQSELLQSSIEFQETSVREIMTPRTETVAIDLKDDPEKILETIRGSRFSRLPVYEGSIDNIVGILILNHFYRASVDEGVTEESIDIRSLLLPTCFLHKTMKLPAAIRVLKEKETHIAIVIDEFGGTLGIVTMEDILEELVGDIWDESDTIVTEIRKTGTNTYEVLGVMNIDDFFAEIDFSPRNFECEYSTVGGFAIQMLNADPHVGDNFSYENLHVVVTEMTDFSVTKLTVLVTPKEEEEE